MYIRTRRAFTLMELLVVIAIIAMLVSIIMPSLGKARESGKRAVCLANLRGIGQSIYVYANQNDDMLVPGDSRVPWEAWGEVAQKSGCAIPASGYRQVNLGHLMASADIIPLPSGSDHVFFCPSGKGPGGQRATIEFEKEWGRANGHAATNYMFNNALDGCDNYVQAGKTPVLSHEDVVQYLMPDGSAHVFKNKPLIYDASIGQERLQEVAVRYGVCFPSILLHEWFAEGRVDMDEANAFLSDPAGWTESNRTPMASGIMLANVGRTSLVSDVVGVWGGPATDPPSG
jgi:prepilin-type N-terminal cleavage/methylation domain-containing protein